MVCADRLAETPDIGNTISSPNKLRATDSKKVTEFRVWPMIHNPVAVHGNYLAVFICSVFEMDKERRSFPSVGNMLIVIIF